MHFKDTDNAIDTINSVLSKRGSDRAKGKKSRIKIDYDI